MAIALVLGIVLLPILLNCFYRSAADQSAFDRNDPRRYWTERYPQPLLSVLFLSLFCLSMLHMAIFFQGIFPFLGTILLGRRAVHLISVTDCELIASARPKSLAEFNHSQSDGFPSTEETMLICFAAPLFSQAEQAFNRRLTAILEERGFDVFPPQRDGVESNRPPYAGNVDSTDDVMMAHIEWNGSR